MNEKSINAFVDKIVEAIDARIAKKPKAKYTQAEVLRVEGDTAWVHIPGGADETPVKNTISCKQGDTVQCKIGDGASVIIGNQTAPPTDDTKAIAAQKTADKAVNAAKIANDSAEKTQQYFWYVNGTGTEAGAHVTEVPKDYFLKTPTGGNLLIKSTGIYLRQAATTLLKLLSTGLEIFEPTDSVNPVAQFLSSGAIIGKRNSSYVTINSSGMQVRAGGNVLFADSGGLAYQNSSGQFAIGANSGGAYFSCGSANNGLQFNAKGEIVNENVLAYKIRGFPLYSTSETAFNIKDTQNNTTPLDVKWNGDVNSIGKLTAGAFDSSLFTVETYTLTLSTSSMSDGDHLEYSETKTKSGYYPLCVAGFHSNKQRTAVRSCYLTSIGDGTCNINIHIRNDSGGTATADITADVDVLWLKTTA